MENYGGGHEKVFLHSGGNRLFVFSRDGERAAAGQPLVTQSQRRLFRRQSPRKGPDTSPNAPAYENGPTNGDILPVDPWARARDRSGIVTWRGSGQHGKLNYVGEATTYTDAQGQEMIAPEVNRHNMLVMTEHLRNMGYKIPESYDQKIKDMPKAYGKLLRENYDKVFSAEDPFGKSFSRILTDVEDGTGLDFENILFNTMDILGTD